MDWNQVLLEAETTETKNIEAIGEALLTDNEVMIMISQWPSTHHEESSLWMSSWLQKNSKTLQNSERNTLRDIAAMREGPNTDTVNYYLESNPSAISAWLYSKTYHDGEESSSGGSRSERKFVNAPHWKNQGEHTERLEDLHSQVKEKVISHRESFDSVAFSSFGGSSDPVHYIASVVANAVTPSDLLGTVVEIEWDLKKYVMTEMSIGQALEDMLTVTGTTDCAWAAACKEYTQWMWPKTGKTVLQAFRKLVVWWEKFHNGLMAPSSAYDGDFGVDISATAQSTIRVKIQGTKKETTQVTQQLAWLASVFRLGCGELAQSELRILALPTMSCNRFSLRLSALRQTPDVGSSCWLPFFRGGVIASGFPTPERASEFGVEISFDAMIRLANVEYPIHYGNVIVFKSWSTLLFLVRASMDFSKIQWHFVSCDEPDDPRLTDALSSIRHVPN